ncbi:MAG: T9SS type A sorting domain-containing protein [Candidatus Kapaibacterium sp.]
MSSNLYAVQDSIIPLTAKTGWQETYNKIQRDYGTPTLFKAYPEKEIDILDTLLCADTIYRPDDLTSRYWKGKAYKWVYECRIAELSKDSMYKITVHLERMKPPFIIKETIYKPITEFADTVGIAEDSWFDSDSIYKSSKTQWPIMRSIYLNRSLPESYKPDSDKVRTMWNMEELNSMGERVGWLSCDARTGEILRSGVVYVTEPPEIELNGAKLTPNPVSNSFSIIGIDNILSVRILNTLGREVKQLQLVHGQVNVDVSDIAPGVYFVQMRAASGMMTTSMVVCR